MSVRAHCTSTIDLKHSFSLHHNRHLLAVRRLSLFLTDRSDRLALRLKIFSRVFSKESFCPGKFLSEKLCRTRRLFSLAGISEKKS